MKYSVVLCVGTGTYVWKIARNLVAGNQLDFQARLEANWADWSLLGGSNLLLRELKSIAVKPILTPSLKT